MMNKLSWPAAWQEWASEHDPVERGNAYEWLVNAVYELRRNVYDEKDRPVVDASEAVPDKQIVKTLSNYIDDAVLLDSYEQDLTPNEAANRDEFRST